MTEEIHLSNESHPNKKESLLHVILSDADFADVTLVSGDNQHVAAHRAVLGASSPFLRRILFESLQQRTFLYLGQVDRQAVEALVQWLYLGKCQVDRGQMAQLCSLAGQLGVQDLQEATAAVIGQGRQEQQEDIAAVIGQDKKEQQEATGDMIGPDLQSLQKATHDFIVPDMQDPPQHDLVKLELIHNDLDEIPDSSKVPRNVMSNKNSFERDEIEKIEQPIPDFGGFPVWSKPLKMFACDNSNCTFLTRRKRDLKKHKQSRGCPRTETQVGNFTCSHCGEGGKTKQSLDNHLHFLKCKTQFKCPAPKCNNSFRTRKESTEHKFVCFFGNIQE